MNQLEMLNVKINEANIAFHVTNVPLMSDYEFDMLVQQRDTLKETNPELTSAVPESNIGCNLTSAPEETVIKHHSPMLSLSNCYSPEEILTWVNKIVTTEYVVSPKYDGIAIELVYDKGILVTASTRGDSIYGSNLYPTIMRSINIPKTVTTQELAVVRGELMVEIEAVEIINTVGGYNYTSAQACASAIARTHNPQDELCRFLLVVPYGMEYPNGEQLPTLVDALKEVVKIGFKWVTYLTATTGEMAERLSYYGLDKGLNLQHLAAKPEFTLLGETNSVGTLALDGIVVAINDTSLFETKGATAKAPRGAKALKFLPTYETGIVKYLVFGFGPTGRETAVAHLKHPVRIGVKEISKVNVYNKREVQRLGIKASYKVNIYLAGGVIPKIHSVVDK